MAWKSDADWSVGFMTIVRMMLTSLLNSFYRLYKEKNPCSSNSNILK